MCCKPKYRANIINNFIFVFFVYFLHYSSCRKDQFTVLILKFGTQDFTNPGLQKIRPDPHWFVVMVLPSQVFLIDAFYGSEKVEKRFCFCGLFIFKGHHSSSEIQSLKLDMWERHHFSKEGIQSEYLFCQKWNINFKG